MLYSILLDSSFHLVVLYRQRVTCSPWQLAKSAAYIYLWRKKRILIFFLLPVSSMAKFWENKIFSASKFWHWRKQQYMGRHVPPVFDVPPGIIHSLRMHFIRRDSYITAQLNRCAITRPPPLFFLDAWLEIKTILDDERQGDANIDKCLLKPNDGVSY